jgi:tetratricopeptide (TPR) repeat protein
VGGPLRASTRAMRTAWITLGATGCMLATVAWSPIAHAQNSKVAAEALFEEGRKLIAQRNPAQACPKFAESQRLDPSPSTLLNLGSCYERIGKTASAWATYREAASAASAHDRSSLVTVAQHHAAAIEPELARLVIAPSTPVEGLEITRDGQRVGRGEWEVAVPVDPGTIKVEAVAPKKKRWSTSIEVAQAGKTVTLTVPTLDDAPPEPLALAQPTTTTTSAEMDGRPAADSAAPAPHVVAWQKPAAVVAGGVGIAGLALGTVFVLRAKSKYDDSLAQCPSNNNLCTQQGVSLRDDARSAGNIATASFIAGAVSLGAGAVLWLTAPRTEQPRTSAEFHLSPTPGGAMIYGQW